MKNVFSLVALTVCFVLPMHAQNLEAQLEEIHNYVRVSDALSSSGQISYDQVKTLKEAGFEVIINLAPAAESRNALEGFLAIQEGMSYVHIPVSWQDPSPADLQLFFDVMEASKDRKVFVHCFANMRASAFVYLYRTLHQDVSEEEALAAMHKVWDPMELEQWANLITMTKAGYSAP